MAPKRRFTTAAALILLVCGLGGPSSAAEDDLRAKERDWSVDFIPYLWVVNVDGEIGAGPISNNFGVGIVSVLEHLQGMAMADLNLRYKRVGVIADGMWSDLSASDLTRVPGGVYVSTKLDLSMAFGTGAAFYRFRPRPGLTLDPYIGARWWRLHTTLGLVDVNGTAPSEYVDGVLSWADPVFGLNVNYDINDKWRVKLAGDVGGGVSKVSWQAMVGGGYQFTPWFDIDLVYRVMGVDYEPGIGQIALKLNGILFGFHFHY